MNTTNNSNFIDDLKCFEVQKKYNVNCQRKNCKNWINYEKCNNCANIAIQQGPLTLQEIGKIYSLTRMRICQIEKNICKYLNSELKSSFILD